MSVTPSADVPARSPAIPSWSISVVLHVVLVLMLGWMIRQTPPGAAEEPGRDVGIVLKHSSEQGEYYEGEDNLPQNATQAAATNPSDAVAALPTDTAALDPSAALPSAQAVIGPGALESGGVAGAGDLAQGAAQPRSLAGGQARVSVYGVQGEGRKFVFVFDRSVSMAGEPLASAKYQLIESLNSLESTHQFQIVFFNHNRRVFDLSGGQNRIPFASDRTKELARRFVGSTTADGGTDRYSALMLAVGMQPDVIFFLTDVDDPMSAGELERVRRKNKGVAAIQTIEFGFGPSPGGDNFLARLARQNGGQYTYVDTSRLSR